MKGILIVSGSNTFLEALTPVFTESSAFEAVFTNDGYQALDALGDHPDSVLVTDARIARMGCLDIIAHLTCRQSSIPVIALPDCGKPWFERRLGQRELLYYLNRRDRSDALTDAIAVGFQIHHDESSCRGLTVSSLLPLIELEKKTCRLTIQAEKGEKGYLYLRNGVLIDAHFSDLSGERAARQIAAWDRIGVEVSDLPSRRSRIKVLTTLMDLAGATWVREDSEGGNRIVTVTPGRDASVTGAFPSTESAAAGILKKFAGEFRLIKGFVGMAVIDGNGNRLATACVGDAGELDRAVKESSEFLASFSGTPGKRNHGQMGAFSFHTRAGTVFVASIRIPDDPACQLVALTAAGTSLAFARIHIQNIFLRMMMGPEC